MRYLPVLALVLPALAAAQYNLDSSKWSQGGLVDAHFSSILYSFDQLDYPVAIDCSQSIPFGEDGNASTLSMTIDVGALSGGQINYIATATGSLNTATGVFTTSVNQTGLNVPFTVNVNGTNYNLVMTSVAVTMNGTVSGSNSCFIGNSWRNPGSLLTSDSVTSKATIKGYFDVIFHPTWTFTAENFRVTSELCDCPGVTIGGTIELQNISCPPTGQQVEVIVRNGTTSETSTATLDSGGGYSVTTHIAGPVTVLAKGSHWLRAKTTANTSGGNVTGADLSLINGDVDGDNLIGLPDLNAIFIAFGSTDGGPEDLDCSGQVGVDDMNIVFIGFGTLGEN